MNIILALGTIDETIVAKMNEIVKQRTEAAHPLLQRRDHMLPKAERAPRPREGCLTGSSGSVGVLANHKYKDRNGQWRCDTVKDITGLALRAWCAEKSVQYT